MRHPFRWAMVAITAVLVAAMPVEAAASTTADGSVTTAPDGTTVTTGELQVAHADDFKTNTAKYTYSLKTSHGTLKLAFIGQGPRGSGGATVQVLGDQVGNTIHVPPAAPEGGVHVVRRARTLAEGGSVLAAGGTTGTTDPQAAPADVLASGPTAVTVAVVLVNFSNDARVPVTVANANSIVFTNGNSVANFFAEESRGAVSVSGAVFGTYTLPDDNTGCAWQKWGTDAMAAAAAAGHNVSGYDHVIFAWPTASSCGWAGLGYVPGAYTYNNGSFSLRVLAHELSHNLGIGHASSLTCTSGATVVALSSTCSFSEYGDPFTVMGSGSSYHNDGEQLGEMGWLRAGELTTVTPNGSTYTLKPVLGSTPGSAMVLRIARGDGTWFFLDVRTTVGPYFDTFAAGSAAVTGVMIRLSPDSGAPIRNPQNTKLIDTNPATSTFYDAPLAVGKTLDDPVSHISITTLSVDASGATVRVSTSGGPNVPSAFTATATGPTAVDLAWQAATGGNVATAYTLLRDGAPLATLPASARSFHDAGVSASTRYLYSITATDGSATVSPPATSSVSSPGAPPADPIPPTAPGALTATPASATTVVLSWTTGTDDQGVAGYRIERNGIVVASTASTGWTDTHRTPSTTYSYAVQTIDLSSNLSPAATAVAKTPADTIRPTKPTTVHAKRLSSTRERLSWSKATDNVGVVRYIVYRVGRSKAVASTTKLTVTIHRVAGARYYVRAVDAHGNRSALSKVARAV